jgi:FMN phosphatase YigB (HAD superfamily)
VTPAAQRRTLAAILDAGCPVVSFDLFDTLLLRGTRPELQRFGDAARAQHAALTAAGLASPGADALYRGRLRAHKAAYDRVRRAGAGEVRHADILAEVCRLCALPPGAAAILADAELDRERYALRLNRPLLAVLREARARCRVVIASDMYLSAAQVGRLIAWIAPDLAGVPLHVSSEVGASKRRGDLFAAVAAAEGVSPAALLHVGDDPVNDVAQARAAGCRALHLPRPAPWRAVRTARASWVRWSLARRGWLAGEAP